jgi:hypothetical protein
MVRSNRRHSTFQTRYKRMEVLTLRYSIPIERTEHTERHPDTPSGGVSNHQDGANQSCCDVYVRLSTAYSGAFGTNPPQHGTMTNCAVCPRILAPKRA